jgi:hypothetical protein
MGHIEAAIDPVGDIEEKSDADDVGEVAVHGVTMQCGQDLPKLLVGEVREEDLCGVVEGVAVEG